MNLLPMLVEHVATLFIVPLAIFTILVALPRDRAMQAALGLVGAAFAYLLLARLLMLPPFSGDHGSNASLRAALFFWTLSLILAMIVQAVSPFLWARRVLYLLLALAMGLLVGLPTLSMTF